MITLPNKNNNTKQKPTTKTIKPKKKLLRKQKKWFRGKLIIKKIEKGNKKKITAWRLFTFMHGAQVWHEISCTYQNHVGLQEDCHRPVLTGLLLREREQNPPFDVIPDNSRVLTFQSIYNGTYIPQQRRDCFRIVLKVEKLTWHQFCTKGLTALMSIRCSC